MSQVSGYDLIGDIHGHAEQLIALLKKLGYTNGETGFKHAQRKVIFVGDFIDRGEHLRQHKQLLEIVMTMIENGHALAVMGNHEFNALAFHTMHNGKPLRPHIQKNINQHQAFLNEFADEDDLKQQVLDFFYQLPLWLDLGELRVVHACWDPSYIEGLSKYLTAENLLTPETLIDASTKGSYAYAAVERLLKGVEFDLPHGISFKDKAGDERKEARIQWWNQSAKNLGEIVLPLGLDIGIAASDDIPPKIPFYSNDSPPCFIGHYWMKGSPKVLTNNVACLDYSVAIGGSLVAYRWSGERVLTSENFVVSG
jgi:hypothetical protein